MLRVCSLLLDQCHCFVGEGTGGQRLHYIQCEVSYVHMYVMYREHQEGAGEVVAELRPGRGVGEVGAGLRPEVVGEAGHLPQLRLLHRCPLVEFSTKYVSE